MFKAITEYLHKISFGNTGAQQQYQWPKYFNLKIEEGFLLVSIPFTLLHYQCWKNRPTTNVCQTLFWQHWAQLRDGRTCIFNLKVHSFVGLKGN